MKYISGCTVFSDGSLIITSYPCFNFSDSYKLLIHDNNNNKLWSGSTTEHQTEVAIFTSRFDLSLDNS